MSRIGAKAGRLIAGAVFLSAVFIGLWFMGILSVGEHDRQETETAGQKKGRVWEIFFKGMMLTIPEKGVAGIHETGCFNVRQKDDYLIQFDIKEDTIENVWTEIDGRMDSLTEDGYRTEKEPERIWYGEKEYIRYVVSLEKERGSEYDRSYFEVLLTSAGEERYFLTVICYDGIDLDNLKPEAREKMYEEAAYAAADILNGAVPTEESDDEAGTLWMEDVNIDPNQSYTSEDSISCKDGEWIVTYHLPQNCQIISDNIAGKSYLDTDNMSYIQVSIVDFTWQTAEEMAPKLADAELSRIHTRGELEAGDKTFYYYTYSVLEYRKNKKETRYYFHAFCDLENDGIYCIYGYGDDCPQVLDEMYYLEVMDITESNILQAETPH